jgi:nucleoside-diphosphate-sugar epimerase
VENPRLINEINVSGTLNLLTAAKEARVKRFVYASSSSVYGDEPSLPKKEGNEGRLLSPYAVSKAVGEKYCQVFSHLYELQTVSLRYFNIFGPRQDPHSEYAAVIPLFIKAILAGKRPVVFGDGEQSRDFTYVRNVVEANLLALEAKGVSGEVMNIGCGERTTVNALAALINRILETDIQAVHGPSRPGDVRHSFADISKAGAMLKYRPSVAFRKGLERTIGWSSGRKQE